MNMATQPDNWVPVIEEALLKEEVPTAVFPKGLPLLLIKKSDREIYALSGRCPHMGCPLRRGALDGYILRCPCHDWRFDIRTGVFVDAKEISLVVYEVKAENGSIMVNVLEG